MIKIYTVAQAKATILRRERALDPSVPESLRAGLRRIFGNDISPEAAVSRILDSVRQNGDDALREWTRKIDGIELDNLEVARADLEQSLTRVPGKLVDALGLAATRIRQFHNQQPLQTWNTRSMGGRLGQRVTPLRRVGVYVPGGTAPLPSSLLMSVIPAQVAGVKEIVVATPPNSTQGQIPDVILAAAQITGVDTVYKLGGAQAIAALAFGTSTIPRVDKVVGAGNLFVTLAKRQVYGLVGIDGLYGPTETVIIADESANPAWVAADLLAQAEHDVLATAILFTDSPRLASQVQAQVAQQIEQLSRAEVIATSLQDRGGIIVTADLNEAVALANAFAPEHLCIATAQPTQWVDQLEHAGGLFVGERSFEVLGDYVAGPSHVMPTGGTARFASPLSAADFVRITSIIELDEATATQLSPVAALIANSEQLTAHAQAARFRFSQSELSSDSDLEAPSESGVASPWT